MTSSQKFYYALNQFLMGAKFNSLPADIAEEAKEFAEDWDYLLENIPKLKLNSPVESTFLSLLRTPEYSLCVSSSGSLLLISRIVELVQQGHISPEDGSNWAPAVISNLEVIDVGDIAVNDGTLYVPKKYLEAGVDLDGAMRRMFYLRCWGAENPSDELKSLVLTLKSIVEPSDEITMSSKEMTTIFSLFKRTGVHPRTLTSTALFVHDLAPVYAQMGILGWWSNTEKSSVAIMVPRGKGARLVQVAIPTTEVVSMYTRTPDALKSLYVQGQKIVCDGALL